MRPVCFAVLSLLAVHCVAETRSVDGVVKTAAGAPVAAMSVAVTLMPSAQADDVAAIVVTGAGGKFHFNLPPGKYMVSATSATTCGDVAIADLTTAAVHDLQLKTSDSCRVISGAVTGAKDVHVIAGRFQGENPDVYAIAAPAGHYKIALPDNSLLVVQGIAPKFVSVEMPIAAKSGDATADLVLERHFTAMPDEARKWVAANAIPLTTVEAGKGFDDLAPLQKLVGNARIVSLGEATHGTREFFQFKHRMLEFLVTKMGFNLFGIEASSPDAIAVDDYVMTGKGDPALALHNLGFWTWDTQEVLDMILWMRKWNEDPAHTTKVRFYGFDMQSPSAAEKRLRPWLTANLPDAVALLDRAAPLMTRGGMTTDQRKDVTAAVAELITKIDAQPSHDAAWLNARHFAELLQQAIPLDVEHGARDRAMAENIRWILDHEQPNSKMVVWAHNGHVAAEALPFSPGGTMGYHLRKMFGAQMVVIGFVFDHGKFRAVHRAKGLIEHTAMSLEDKTFDRGLATSGPPLFVLDLRPAKGLTREWLESPLENRSIGAVYDEANPRNYIGRIHPLRSFDAIFFISETTAAHSLRPATAPAPSGPKPPPPAPAPVNLSLDDGTAGWKATTPQSYPITATTDGCFKGGCVTTTRKSDATTQFGVFMQRVDATPYRGKRIRLRAKMKSTMTGEGSARLWLRVDKPGGVGFFDNMAGRGIHSLPEWTDLEIIGEVAPDAESVNFGLLIEGDGTAMMDEVTLEEVK